MRSNRHVIVTEINWREALLFPRIVSAFTMAAQPGRLLMGLAIVTVLMLGGSLWDAVAGPTVGPAGLADLSDADALESELRLIARDGSFGESAIAGELSTRERLTVEDVRAAWIEWYRALDEDGRDRARPEIDRTLGRLEAIEPRGVFQATVDETRVVLAALISPDPNLDLSDRLVLATQFKPALILALWRDHPVFLAVYGLWFFIVVFIGGAMISRSVACEFAITQYIPWTEALAFALKRSLTLISTALLPAIAIVIGLLLLAIGGLLFRIPALDVLGGLLYGPALFGGFLLAIILVLGVFGFGLFVPAVTVESADAPDAISRAFAYVKNRPLHLLWYLVLASIIGWLGFVVVAGLAWLTINLTAYGASMFFESSAVLEHAEARSLVDFSGYGSELDLSPTGRAAVALIGLWKTIIAGLVAGYLFSFSYAAWTVIYFLLRKVVDDQDLDEIWQPGLIEGTLAPEVVDAG
ncbi:MAG: hypothetical protein ACF8PN_15485 [Phycisphaerales bacterium]